MKKREINVFNISFLDLLSGALAAVILLFVIVPKLDIVSEEDFEVYKELRRQFTSFDSLAVSLKGSIPEKEYNKILDAVRGLQLAARAAEESQRRTEAHNRELVKEKGELEQALAQAIYDLGQCEKALKEATEKLKKCVPKTEPPPVIAEKDPKRDKPTEPPPVSPTDTIKDNKPPIKSEGSFYFGFNPPLAIMVSWENTKSNVDLYLQNEKGAFCDYFNRKMSFGRWQRIPRKLNPKPNQAIIQEKLKPGTYKIYANIGKKNIPATPVDILIVFNPAEGEGTKVFNRKGIMITATPPPHLNRPDSGTLIGEIQITETNFNFIPAI